MNTLSIKKKDVSVRKAIRLVNNAVNEVCLLQKTIQNQSSDNKKSIANALVRQKRALSKLRQWAGEGSAIAGAGYVKACCVSGQQVDYIFNFRDNYTNSDGADYLSKLFEPARLIPFLHKQDVLNKTQFVAAFIMELPDLSQTSFNPAVFDALHTPNLNGITFNQQLSDKLLKVYQKAENETGDAPSEKAVLLKVIEMTAKKGYAGVQNLYSSILFRTNNRADAHHMAQVVLTNKYGSAEDVAVAQRILKSSQNRLLPRMAHTNGMAA